MEKSKKGIRRAFRKAYTRILGQHHGNRLSVFEIECGYLKIGNGNGDYVVVHFNEKGKVVC